ncbi:MAG: glycosyltransferase family 2 protein [Pseudorhodoplanes sp.]|nr:glycosyltransferase family 2 protein [Pseudorhodoplanes sp.]
MQGIPVVLPNFNHAIELETSLGATTRQTHAFDEIIVIDDASTDHSLEIIRRFARTNPQLRVLQNEKRMGVAISVNRGIEAASRRYLVLASADEKVKPNMCETLHGALQEFPDLHLAISCYREWDERTGIVTNYGRQPGLGMWYASHDEPFFCIATTISEFAQTTIRVARHQHGYVPAGHAPQGWRV